MSRALIIINPHSGGSRRRYARKLYALGEKQGHSLAVTDTLDDLKSSLQKAYDHGITTFAWAGGDGSWNKAVNAIHELGIPFSEVKLGLLPTGTGNDWAKMYGLSPRPEVLLHALEKGAFFECPLAQIDFPESNQSHVFTNIAGAGFDAVVAQRVERSPKKNRLIYLRHILSSLPKHRPQFMSWMLDDKDYGDEVFSIHIGIGQSSGGGLRISPNTPLFPDQLYVTVVKKASAWDYGRALPSLIRGRIENLSFIDMHTAASVRLNPNSWKAGVECDGEWLGHLPCNIKMSSHQMKVVDSRSHPTSIDD